eukprot:scaffold1300_cov317-Prasinococcus_capsulatus_cf.AAC.4
MAEMIAIDQDPLGKAGARVSPKGSEEVWLRRELVDGSAALVLFYKGDEDSTPATTTGEAFPSVAATSASSRTSSNRGSSGAKALVSPRETTTMSVNFADLGLVERQQVRDVVQQQDLGVMRASLSAEVELHGVRVFKLTPVASARNADPDAAYAASSTTMSAA